jgi:hypothetical protein
MFLSKALGLYFVIIGVAMILNGKRLKPALMDIMASPGLLLVTGFIALILGILLVLNHNIWVYDWHLIITVAGWAALIKGALLILSLPFFTNICKAWVRNNFTYYVTSLLVLFAGGYLGYHACIYDKKVEVIDTLAKKLSKPRPAPRWVPKPAKKIDPSSS